MQKHWHSMGALSNAFTADGTAINSPLALSGPFTVIRMLGEYTIHPTGGGTFAAVDACAVNVAIGVVSSDAAAVGASAVPDPTGEPDYPWLYWASHPISFVVATADQNNPGAALRHSFDIHSMRKIKPRESLIMVAEYADLSGTPPMTIDAGQTRVLVAT